MLPALCLLLFSTVTTFILCVFAIVRVNYDNFCALECLNRAIVVPFCLFVWLLECVYVCAWIS